MEFKICNVTTEIAHGCAKMSHNSSLQLLVRGEHVLTNGFVPGRCTLRNFLQPQKVQSPMCVTGSGILYITSVS